MYLKHSRTHRNHSKGFGLPTAIFVIVILSFMALAVTNITEVGNRSIVHDYLSQQAFYAAESGAQISINRIMVGELNCASASADIDFDATGDNPGLNSCVAALTCSMDSIDDTEYYSITSTGSCGAGDDLAERSVAVQLAKRN